MKKPLIIPLLLLFFTACESQKYKEVCENINGTILKIESEYEKLSRLEDKFSFGFAKEGKTIRYAIVEWENGKRERVVNDTGLEGDKIQKKICKYL